MARERLPRVVSVGPRVAPSNLREALGRAVLRPSVISAPGLIITWFLHTQKHHKHRGDPLHQC